MLIYTLKYLLFFLKKKDIFNKIFYSYKINHQNVSQVFLYHFSNSVFHHRKLWRTCWNYKKRMLLGVKQIISQRWQCWRIYHVNKRTFHLSIMIIWYISFAICGYTLSCNKKIAPPPNVSISHLHEFIDFFASSPIILLYCIILQMSLHSSIFDFSALSIYRLYLSVKSILNITNHS